MPRSCSICSHEKRQEIDSALLRGQSFRNVARRYGTSRSALFRHKEHIPLAMVKAQEAREIDYGDDLFLQVRTLNDRTLRILETAEQSDDPRLALMAVREARGNSELMCKMIVAAEMRKEQLPPERSSAEILQSIRLAVWGVRNRQQEETTAPAGGRDDPP